MPYRFLHTATTMSSHVRIFSLLAAATLALGQITRGHAEEEDDEAEPTAPDRTYLWTGDGEDPTWSNPDNWQNGRVPPPSASGTLAFSGRGTIPVQFDRDQEFHGHLNLVGPASSRPELDLHGHRFSLTSGRLEIGGHRNTSQIKNGTLILGDHGPVEVDAYHFAGDDRTSILGPDLTIETRHLDQIQIAVAGGNRTAIGALDLSEARFQDHHLTLKNDLVIGRYDGATSGRSTRGTVKLPDTLGEFTLRRMILGWNQRRQGSGNPGHCHGILDFGGGVEMTVTVQTWLSLATGDNTFGVWENLPAKLNLRLGSEEVPAVVRLGYNDRSQGDTEPPDHSAEAVLKLPPGELTVHLRELRLGHNTQPGGSAHGVLDLSAMTLHSFAVTGQPDLQTYYLPDLTATTLYDEETVIDAPQVLEGAIVIGRGLGGQGRLALPSGDVNTFWLLVGDHAEESEGRLELHQTRLTVEDRLEVGPTGRITLRTSDSGLLRIEKPGRAVLEAQPSIDIHAEADHGPVMVLDGEYQELLNTWLTKDRIHVKDAEGNRLEPSVQTENGETFLMLP